jgi:hypothetical protein
MQTQSPDAIERFVRDELGCQCAPAVFHRIDVEDCPEQFGRWPQSRLISVGGRLLILVLRSDDSLAMHRRLGGLLEAGRRLRETRGFNRFRLVIATPRAGVIASSLRERFDRLEGKDTRMHLHVIAPGQLPAALA